MSATNQDSGASRRRLLVIVAVGATALAVLGMAWAAGARPGSATMGLLAVAAALGLALRALYNMANVLRQPPVEVELAYHGALGRASQRHLREEKRRLVRAINELTFDHEMGKLSKEDYQAVREVYELKAVEVMRALSADGELHPALLDDLGRLDVPVDPRGGSAAPIAAAKAGAAKAEADAARDEGGDDEDEAAVAEPTPEPTASDAAEPEPEASAASDDSPGDGEDAPAKEASPTCSACDTVNDVDARFCKKCGKELAA